MAGQAVVAKARCLVILHGGSTTKTEKITIKLSTGGGTGEGTTGGLTLEKSETGSDRPLKDVAFSLVKTIAGKEVVVRTGTTDDQGKLEWKGLKFGDYKLRETIPEGYTGTEEQDITISSKDPKGIKILGIENKRETGKMSIMKVDAATGDSLKDAVFTLKNQTINQEYTFTTDDDGEILEEVPYGEYTVKEITAPDGYRITKDIPNITVEIDKIAEVEIENIAFVDIEGEKTWIVDGGKRSIL